MTNINEMPKNMPKHSKRSKRSRIRFLLIILTSALVLGAGLLLVILNPSLLNRVMTLLPNDRDTELSSPVKVESVIEPVDLVLPDEPILAQPVPEIGRPVEPDPAFLEVTEQIRQLEERIAFQAAQYQTLSGQLRDMRDEVATHTGRWAEIITRLEMTETVDIDTFTRLLDRQEHLENRQLERDHFHATNMDAVVGSLSLVKQKTADLEDMISNLSSDLYLLSRYGYGNERQTGVLSGIHPQRPAKSSSATTSPPIRRGDYRVGDWIQGYGEVLSIHRTVEGDYLTTENGEVFATAVPDED